MKIKQPIFLFVWLFISVVGGFFSVLAQEPLPAITKSDILRYREQRDIFSEDLHGLGYIESAQVLNDETSSEKNLLYYYRLGKDYFYSRQYEKALVEFKKALEWDPQYKPALKYVDLTEEEMKKQRQIKEKKESAEKKVKEEEERRQEREFARLNLKEKARYEQDIKAQQERSRSFKKLNEAKVKDVLNVKLKHYESDKRIYEELLREQEKIKAKNAKLEKLALLKAEKEQSDKFRREKLAKEKEIQSRNLEQNKRLAEDQRQKDLAGRMAAEEILSLDAGKAKQEQFIKLELEKSRNFRKLNEGRFREELSQRSKEPDTIPGRKPGINADLSKGPGSLGFKEFITDKPSQDSLESPKIQRGFEDKYTTLFKENEAIKKDYNDLLVQVKELLPDSDRVRELETLLGKNNSTLELYKKENERVKKDYSNLLLQVKMLLVYRQRIKTLEGLLEDNKINIISLGQEKGVAVLEKNELKKRNEELQQLQPQILKERDVYKDAYEKLKDTYEKLYNEAVTNKLKVNQFADESSVLKRENKDMESELRQLRAEKKKIENDYSDVLTKLKRLIPETRRLKEIENVSVKSKANLSSLKKEKNALKEERSRVLSQMKGLLGDRRRVKELESLLEESNSNIKVMQKENDIIRKDYNSLLVQVKASLIDKNRLQDLEGELDKKKADMNLLIKDSETIKAENVKLKHTVKQFEDEQAKLFQDRDKYKTAHENGRNDTTVKELKNGMLNLEKEKSGLSSQLKQAQRENETIKKDYNGLLSQVKDLLTDKNRLKEFEDVIEKDKADKRLLEKDNKSVKSENLELQNKIKELENLQAQVSKARDEYKASYENERNGAENAKKESLKLQDKIKEFENLQAQLSKARDEYKASYENERNGAENAKKESLKLQDKIKELENLQAQVSKARDEYKASYENERNGAENAKKENLKLRNKIEEFESMAAKSKDEYKAKAVLKEETSGTVMKEVKQMQKENELIKKDYAALLAQMKGLLADSRRVKESQSLSEKDKANMAFLEKEKEAVKAENIALKNKLNRLEELERKLLKASRDSLGNGNELSAKKLKIKERRAEDINTQETALLTQSQPDDAQAKELQSKLEAEKKQLSRQAEEYKNKYLNELEKNNLSMQKTGNSLPQKFSEAVKKNEELLKETSGMHYNLGVFFIKNKEYDRAIVEFEKAIEMSPEDSYSYYNLGYIYAQYLIDRGKAVKYFRQFLQFVKNDDKDVEWVKDYLLTWESYK